MNVITHFGFLHDLTGYSETPYPSFRISKYAQKVGIVKLDVYLAPIGLILSMKKANFTLFICF